MQEEIESIDRVWNEILSTPYCCIKHVIIHRELSNLHASACNIDVLYRPLGPL